MTKAEQRARDAVVRAAMNWHLEMRLCGWLPNFPDERRLLVVCGRLAKIQKEKRRVR